MISTMIERVRRPAGILRSHYDDIPFDVLPDFAPLDAHKSDDESREAAAGSRGTAHLESASKFRRMDADAPPPPPTNCPSCRCDFNKDPACPSGFDSCVCPGPWGDGWEEPKSEMQMLS